MSKCGVSANEPETSLPWKAGRDIPRSSASMKGTPVRLRVMAFLSVSIATSRSDITSGGMLLSWDPVDALTL